VRRGRHMELVEVVSGLKEAMRVLADSMRALAERP
jgi:hypothetical protein